jgi:hypothetical protein
MGQAEGEVERLGRALIMSRGLVLGRGSRRGLTHAPVIVEAVAPCVDVSAGRPQGSPVIDIVIGPRWLRSSPVSMPWP